MEKIRDGEFYASKEARINKIIFASYRQAANVV